MPYPLIAGLIFLILLGLTGYRHEKRAARRDFERLRPPGKHIQVNQHCLYLLAAGERQPGHPLVVLESGHGDWSRAWANVIPEIARFSRVVAYDRAGFGWSEPGPTPRSPLRIVDELHELLARAGEPPPYLMVGHSMGGPFSRLFYGLYPQEITGMVWIDTAHENLARYISFVKKGKFGFLASIWLGAVLARLGLVRLVGQRIVAAAFPYIRDPQAITELVAQVVVPKYFDNLLDETREMMRPENWSRSPLTLGNLPVISVEAQYTPEPPKGYPPRQWKVFLAGWEAIHQDLSCLSTDLRRIPAATGHVIMYEQPDMVVHAIREMYARLTGEATGYPD